MRMCIIGLVLVVGLSAAAGFREMCPAYPTGLTEMYETGNCTAAETCSDLACQCITGDASCNDNTVLETNCVKAAGCTAKYNLCLMEAASAIAADATASAICTSWATPFHAKILAAATTYAGSEAQNACKAFACNMMNMTTTMALCANDTIASYDDMCFLPNNAPVTTLSMEILGNWSFLNNNMTQKNEVVAALERDLSAYFGFPVTILNVTVSDVTGAMNVAFSVFSLRGPIEAKIATLATAPLTSVKAIYTQFTGHSASAIVPGVIVDPTGTTAEPVTTTAAPESSSSSSSGGGGGGGGDGSGASTAATLMSVAVAALVAVLAL